MKIIFDIFEDLLGYTDYEEVADTILDEFHFSLPKWIHELCVSKKHDRYLYDEERLVELEEKLIRRNKSKR